jgi:hypothetical protein
MFLGAPIRNIPLVPVIEKPGVTVEKDAMLVRGWNILYLGIDIVNRIRRKSGIT